MTRNYRLGLIAAFIVFAEMSLTRSSNGQVFQPPPLMVPGVASETVYNYQNAPIFTTFNDPATFTLSYQAYPPDIYTLGSLTMTIDGSNLVGPSAPFLFFSGGGTYQEFQSADASVFAGGFDGYTANSFRTSDGSIVADFTFLTYNFSNPILTESAFISFQSVPEPSSLILAATGFLMILIIAAMRHFFSVPVNRPSRSRKIPAGH